MIIWALLSAGASVLAEPLVEDPRLVSGRLDNGVRWLFRHHANPPGRLAVFMHIASGSLNETDRQRGIAHFLEHMMFNGTEHFAPGELVPYFERLGMKFGPDLNASTSFERTTYQLFLPKASEQEIDTALKVLRDYAFGALLTAEEIDKERPVILAEARSKKSAEQRIRDALWPQLYEGTHFAQRLPIGLEEVVSTAPREEFVDYYRTWYRPELITLVFVGDAEPKLLPPLLAKWFTAVGDLRPARKPSSPGFRRFTDERAIVVTDPELTTGSVQLLTTLAGRPPVTTVEQLRVDLVETVAASAFGRRCQRQVQRGKASYRSAGVRIASLFNDALSVSASATGEPSDWEAMLRQLVEEISSAREYGFSEREIDLVRRDILARAERAAQTEDTMNARTIINDIMRVVNDRSPYLGAQQELQLARRLLPTITASEVSRTFKTLYAPGTFAYVLTLPGKDGAAPPAQESVLAIAREAWLKTPTTQDAGQDVSGLLAELPKPGPVSEQTVDSASEVVHAWLENGARVHFRRMDYKKDSFLLSISLGGGAIEETPANLGISVLASIVLNTPSTGTLRSEDIRDLRVGRSVSVGGGPVADDAFAIRLGGPPRELEFGLQLLYALMTDGRIEQPAFENWRRRMLAEIEKHDTSVDDQARDALNALLTSGDPRRLSLRRNHIEALRLEHGQEWFARLCREAPLEVAFVGDASWDDVRPLIEKYIGSLPRRGRSTSHLDVLRKVSRPDGPLTRRVDVKTVTPSAMVYAGFVGASGRDVEDVRTLNVAAGVLTSRLVRRVREELGLVYGITASNAAGWVYLDSGRFFAAARCKPESAEKVAEEVRLQFEAFAATGPTADELVAATKQLLTQLDDTVREPQYWVELLQYFELHGRSLQEPERSRQVYSTVSAERVRDVARKYFTPDRAFTVIASPSATSRPAPAATQSVMR